MAWSQARKEREKAVDARRRVFLSYHTAVILASVAGVIGWICLVPLSWYILAEWGFYDRIMFNWSPLAQSAFVLFAIVAWAAMWPVCHKGSRWFLRFVKQAEDEWIEEKGRLNALEARISDLGEGANAEFGVSIYDESEEEGALSTVDEEGAVSVMDEADGDNRAGR